MEEMINVDLVNMEDPTVGFNGKVKKSGFLSAISERKPIILFMDKGNHMVVSPSMQLKYTFIILGSEEIKQREEIKTKAEQQV